MKKEVVLFLLIICLVSSAYAVNYACTSGVDCPFATIQKKPIPPYTGTSACKTNYEQTAECTKVVDANGKLTSYSCGWERTITAIYRAECRIPCLSKNSFKCYDNDVYYYDSCGTRESKKEDCLSTCQNGVCACANECNTAGVTRCTSDKTGIQTCSVYSSSGSCANYKYWGSAQSCPTGQTCTTGVGGNAYCVNAGNVCGNGIVDTGEECDQDPSIQKDCTSIASNLYSSGYATCHTVISNPDCKWKLDNCKLKDGLGCSSNSQCQSGNCGGPNMKCTPSGYQCYFNAPSQYYKTGYPSVYEDICTSDESPWYTHCDSSKYCTIINTYQCRKDTDGVGKWLTACAGCSNGNCVTPVMGVCGSAHYSCSSGTSTSNREMASQYIWTCQGSNGGSSSSCNEQKCGGEAPTTTIGTIKGLSTYNSGYTTSSWTYITTGTPGACQWRCDSGYEKNANGDGCVVIKACTAETNATFCSRLGKNCGSVTAIDNCGVSRTVNPCGTCTLPQTTCGAVTANVCGTTCTKITYYYDSDNDGYGVENTNYPKQLLCSATGGYRATNNQDCDDTLLNVYPGATEICDNRDNDCDRQIDEGVKNACGGCGAIPPEVCDGVDNNCNGQIDECPTGQVCISNVCAGDVVGCSANSYDDECSGKENCKDILERGTVYSQSSWPCGSNAQIDSCVNFNTVREYYLDCTLCDSIKSTDTNCPANYECSEGKCVISQCSASNCGGCSSSSACGVYNVGTNDCWWDTTNSKCCPDGYVWNLDLNKCTLANPCSPLWPTLPGSVSGGQACCYINKYGTTGNYLTPIQKW